jgi:hypothetical protein
MEQKTCAGNIRKRFMWPVWPILVVNTVVISFLFLE